MSPSASWPTQATLPRPTRHRAAPLAPPPRRGGLTMTTLLVGCLGLAAISPGGLRTASAGPLLISATPASQTVTLGDRVTLDLGISGLGDRTAPSLAAFDLLLTFDPGLFALERILFGAALGDPDADPPESYTDVEDSVAGLIGLVMTSVLETNEQGCFFCTGPYLDDLQSDALLLLTVTLTARRAGIGAFGITINGLADGDGNDLPADTTGATVTVKRPVPAPATLALIALGLIGLRQVGRRPFRTG